MRNLSIDTRQIRGVSICSLFHSLSFHWVYDMIQLETIHPFPKKSTSPRLESKMCQSMRCWYLLTSDLIIGSTLNGSCNWTRYSPFQEGSSSQEAPWTISKEIEDERVARNRNDTAQITNSSKRVQTSKRFHMNSQHKGEDTSCPERLERKTEPSAKDRKFHERDQKRESSRGLKEIKKD